VTAQVPEGLYTRDAWPQVPGARLRKVAHGRDVATVDADVVVVGSGAGGGVVAAELAEAGLDVVVVEEGGYFATEDFSADAGAAVRALYRAGGAQLALGRPPVTFSEGCCVGGSTVVNGGMTWRTPERILDSWRREHGIEGLGPADLEPWFQRIEGMLSARRQDPESVGRDNALLKQGADCLGWRIVENIRNQLHCTGCNNCAWGCPTGAKQSVAVTYVPRALHFGARVLAHVRADRLMVDGGRITGVASHLVGGHIGDGLRIEVRAPLTVVACGAIQTPALLMRSQVRTPSGQLGRRLSLHPNVKVVAIMDAPVRGWEGVHQAYQVTEFDREGLRLAAVNVPPSLVAMTLPTYGGRLREVMTSYDHMLVAGMLLEDSVFGRVRTVAGRPVTSYQLSQRDAFRLQRGTSLLSELLFEVGAREILTPFPDVPPLRDPDDARRLAGRRPNAAGMELVTVHMMGTAAMGTDPARSVCDPWGRVHGVDGLLVADASLFPGPVGINPMETVMVLATRVAAGILGRGCGYQERRAPRHH